MVLFQNDSAADGDDKDEEKGIWEWFENKIFYILHGKVLNCSYFSFYCPATQGNTNCLPNYRKWSISEISNN